MRKRTTTRATTQIPKAPHPTSTQFQGVSVRTDGDDLEARLDRLGEVLSRRAAGVVMKRARVARACLVHGLEALERETGLRA